MGRNRGSLRIKNTSLLEIADIEKKLDCKCTKLFKSMDSSTPYIVAIYKCVTDTETFVVKSSNHVAEIEGEWKTLSYLKDKIAKDDNSEDMKGFVDGCELVVYKPERNASLRKGIKMPFMLEVTDVMKEQWFQEKIHIYCQQLLNQLYHMHRLGVMHCDIKIDNIMYNESMDRVCFIDYGIAEIIDTVVTRKSRDLDLYDINRRLNFNHEIHPTEYRAPECYKEGTIKEYEKWEKSVDSLTNALEKAYNPEILKKYDDAETEREKISDEMELIEENDERLEEMYNRLSVIEGDIEALKKELSTPKSKKLSQDLKKLHNNAPKSNFIFNMYDVSDLIELPYSFRFHNTLSADVYALGACMIESFSDVEDYEQQLFFEGMANKDLTHRTSSKNLLNVEVFDVRENT